MTLNEAEALSLELADRIRAIALMDLEAGRVTVAGIANGGLMIAHIVAESLSAPMEVIGIRRSGSSLKRALGRFRPLVRLTARALEFPVIGPVLVRTIDKMNRLETGDKTPSVGSDELQVALFRQRHVVLIDDCIETGQTIILAKQMLADAGAMAVTTGVITFCGLENDPSKADRFDPLVYINGRSQHHYPWSQNNTAYDEYLAWLDRRGIKPWL